MAYEQRPNNGTFFPTKPGAKCDMTCRINIDGVDYVLFGTKKKRKVRGVDTTLMDVSAMKEQPKEPVVQQQPTGDLPF